MKLTTYNSRLFKETEYYKQLPKDEKETFDTLSKVFHYKSNNYIHEQLICWQNVPDDPIYKLVFPRREMLNPEDYNRLKLLINLGMGAKELEPFIQNIKTRMTPRLKFVKSSFVKLNEKRIDGMCRDFETIISLSPEPMLKTCHSYCSYCLRWMIFNNREIQHTFSYKDPKAPVEYLWKHPEVKDALLTGADPFVPNANILKKYISPLLDIKSLTTIRISTKSLAFWPFRFTTDKDAEDILKLFELIQKKGKHLSFIAHITHVRELENDVIKEAVNRIRNTGAIIRCQGPLISGINDTAEDWSKLWAKQITLGMIPYYMFMDANHHPENCFRVPLAKALNIFQEAQKLTSGTARTVRGPVFMNDINRVLLDGTTTVDGKKYFVLKSLQAPPYSNSEGKIKLIPYNEHTRDTGDLFALFNPEAATKIPAMT